MYIYIFVNIWTVVQHVSLLFSHCTVNFSLKVFQKEEYLKTNLVKSFGSVEFSNYKKNMKLDRFISFRGSIFGS